MAEAVYHGPRRSLRVRETGTLLRRDQSAEVTARDAEILADHPRVTVTEADVPPPKHGRGSGRDAWAAYAAACGVPVADDMSRGDIIAALEDRGSA